MQDFTSQNLYSLSAKLERFEERFAVLNSEVLGEFRWPIKNLPENVQAGEIIELSLRTRSTTEDEKLTRMRKLLEELIN